MKQGEIWDILLNLPGEKENNKNHPAVIISDDTVGALPARLVAPIVEWKEKYRDAVWLVRIEPDNENSLVRTSVIDAFQIRSVSAKGFIAKTGTVSSGIMRNIKEAVKAVINVE